MQNKTRLLLATCLLLVGWLTGFIMGGGIRSSSPGDGKPAESAATAARRAELEAMARRVGTAEKIDSQFGEKAQVEWTQDRLQSTVRGILRHGDFLSLMRQGLAFTDQLRKDDFPLAMEVTQSLKGEDDMAEALGFAVFLRWVELEPRSAAEHLRKTNGFGGWINFQAPLLAMGWGQSNPVEALAFARTLTDETERTNFMENLLKSIARRSPEEAVAFAKTHAPDLATDKMLGAALGESSTAFQAEDTARRMVELGAVDHLDDVVARWAGKDQAAALAWARDLPDAVQRANALSGVFSTMGKKDLRAAAAALLRENVPGGTMGQVINGFATNWPEDDMAAATAWAGKFADEKDRTIAFGTLAERMGIKQPDAGAAWLRTLPEGASRDEAVARYAVQAVRKDGAAGLEWAGTISDPIKRIDVMHRATVDWFERDADGAFNWLNTTTTISAEDKRAMLKGK